MRNLKRVLALAMSAAMLIGMMVVSAGAVDSYEDFTDTDEIVNTEAVQTMVSLGVFNGKGDGTFGPTEQVTGTAAAKMMLTALGYRSDIEGLTGTGWDLKTDTLANKVGLYDGLDAISPSSGLSRDDTAQLVYNGVQAQEIEKAASLRTVIDSMSFVFRLFRSPS